MVPALAKYYAIDSVVALWAIGAVAVLIVAAIGFMLWSAFRNRGE
jgi:hypothetical protein